MSNKYDYLFRFIVVGDSGVGKTCILLKYVKDDFNELYQATLGVSFESKTIAIEDKIIKLQLWDTAGSEAFRAVTKTYYKGASGALLVYDITKRESFENVKRWLAETQENAPKSISIILIGNKKDLEEKREVTYEEGEAFAKVHNLMFLETSAKSGFNIEEAFQQASMQILEQNKNDPSFFQKKNQFKLTTKTEEDSSWSFWTYC